MKIGVIADDFTGASDIALTLAEGGMQVAQFGGVPEQDVPDVDAGVVSLKIRTAPVAEAVSAALEACTWLQARGCTQIIYKVCSTFDSTAEGNIGPVTQALAEKLGETRVVVCPAFPENGRSVYQGHLFVKDGLLNESGMQLHPLTPMTDPDIRRVLAPQTSWNVEHIATDVVFKGRDAIAEALNGAQAMIIVDAIRDADLIEIGAAAKDRKLLCGGSGIAIGLPANFGLNAAPVAWQKQSGGGVVLSGSCSIMTRKQIEQYQKVAPSFEVVAEDLMSGVVTVGTLTDWVLNQDADAPLVYSSASADVVQAAQEKFGKDTIAHKFEQLFAKLAAELANKGITRIVSAGGETSGAVVTGLQAKTLVIGPRIAPGVPAVRVDGRDLVLALKSGNFGSEDFFGKALKFLAG